MRKTVVAIAVALTTVLVVNSFVDLIKSKESSNDNSGW